jgi:16S rRNA (adenine1518-N6/adenine1519-N6)-dimethyltransferase
MNLPEVKRLLRDYNLRPDKRLGQNFLIDEAAFQRILAAADLSGDACVLEIGPGLGGLTRKLAQHAAQVIAVEVDRRFEPALRQVLGSVQNVRLVWEDILQVNLAGLLGERDHVVVANIPYNITSAVMRRLMETENPAYRVVLTVQREVAERVVARAGDMSLLALSVQLYGEAQVTGQIPAGAFYPRPKVASSILRIERYEKPRIAPDMIDRFFQLAKAGFGQKRKKLRNSLASGLGVSTDQVETWMQAAGIDPAQRPQQLNLEQWGALASSSLAPAQE